MKNVLIKVGHQIQADKPIFLLPNGHLVCGNFTYKGRYIKTFAEYHREILKFIHSKPVNNIVDVTTFRYWDAISIYDDYIVPNWQRGITAKKLETFANETAVYKIIEKIKPEFKRSLGKRWRWIFKRSDPNSPDTPRNAWEIL